MRNFEDVIQNLATGDLVEILLTNDFKCEVIFGYLKNNETFIGLDRFMLVPATCKIEDIKSITLLKKAMDFFKSNNQISALDILKKLMDMNEKEEQNKEWEGRTVVCRKCGYKSLDKLPDVCPGCGSINK